jgi:Amino acid permease
MDRWDAWGQTLPEDRLARLLTLTDAVVIRLGAMIGAGIFAAPGPAAEAAGSLLFIGLALAGIVAYANATSSAQLAAVYPESGGTYVYASERLGPFWGILAGWGVHHWQDREPCRYGSDVGVLRVSGPGEADWDRRGRGPHGRELSRGCRKPLP